MSEQGACQPAAVREPKRRQGRRCSGSPPRWAERRDPPGFCALDPTCRKICVPVSFRTTPPARRRFDPGPASNLLLAVLCRRMALEERMGCRGRDDDATPAVQALLAHMKRSGPARPKFENGVRSQGQTERIRFDDSGVLDAPRRDHEDRC